MAHNNTNGMIRNGVYISPDDTVKFRIIWFPVTNQAFNAETGEYIGHVHQQWGRLCICREMHCDPHLN